MSRLSWNEIYFNIITEYKKRSSDAQTQYGCLLVDPNTHRILAMGMNGASSRLYDRYVPNTRPDKYLYVAHSEENMLYSLIGTSINPKGMHVFVDGFPCIFNFGTMGCLQKMYHVGIRDIFIKSHLPKMYGSLETWYKDLCKFQELCKDDINLRVVNSDNSIGIHEYVRNLQSQI